MNVPKPSANFLCTVGPILIYEVKPNSFGFFKNTLYFWKLAEVDGLVGPFYSVIAAMKDWEYKDQQAKFPSNVILVDFKAKKRVR